jgi:hypothetical protein
MPNHREQAQPGSEAWKDVDLFGSWLNISTNGRCQMRIDVVLPVALTKECRVILWLHGSMYSGIHGLDTTQLVCYRNCSQSL